MSIAEAGTSVIKFGTDGWRALMTTDFTEVNVDLVARAIVEFVRSTGDADKGLIVGYDTRDNSRRFAEICAARALQAGVPVYVPARAIPTPVTAFAITHHRTAGGFMITASHNPAAYNGIKFISSLGGPSGPEITTAIEQMIDKVAAQGSVAPLSDGELAEWVAKANELDVLPAYREQLAKVVDFEALAASGMKVAVDAMHGAGYGILSQILSEEAGCQVIALRDVPDPTFGGDMPDPSPSHLGTLRSTVQQQGCTVGLALDGDADRFGVIDAEGNALIPNQVLAVLADHLLQRGMTGSIVRTVATTHLLDKIAESHGAHAVETPVGFKWIAAQMVSTEVLIGGEESGGLSIKGHMPEKDGILADLLLAELAIECDGKLMAKYHDLLERFGHFETKRFDLEIATGKKEALLASLKSAPPTEIAGYQVTEVRDIDGVKLILETGDWVLFRPSGTEPLVRIYVESIESDRFDEVSRAALAIANG